MARKTATFNSHDIRYETRRRIAFHTGIFAMAVVLSCGLLLVVGTNVRHPVNWFVGLGMVCLLPTLYLGYRIYRLSQVVWYIKVTPDQLEGYDYARRKIRISWTDIARIDITAHALTVISTDGRFITLPSNFSEFSTVGHLLFDAAREKEIRVCIDGRAWDALSIYALFPFLEDDQRAAF
jgi:hypothetical protein